MKSRLLITIFILGVLFVSIDKSYGCNQFPVAILSADPEIVLAGNSVLLDGSASYDPDLPQQIAMYEWSWGISGVYDYYETLYHYPDGAFDGKTTHTYTTADTYTVYLRVRDPYGFSDTDTCTVTVGNVIYVDIDANSGGDGTTWANALKYLQDGLEAADDANVADNEIWVADGNYYPDEGTGHADANRVETFQLVADIAVYGGFAGDETSRNERDPATNVTILSGDIDKDSTSDSDNSYNVVVGAAGATLDGFTITMGYANHASTVQYYCGGGMYNSSCSPTVTNCIFKDNYAKYGGGMSNTGSSPTITDCDFTDNEAYIWGGGIENYSSSSPSVTNCNFQGNSTTSEIYYTYGGGMYNIGCSPTITNCIFDDNYAKFGGGMFNDSNSFPTVSDCSFTANEAYYTGGGMYCCSTSAFLDITNCLFRDNEAVNSSGGAICFDTDQQPIDIKSCTFSQNSADNGYGGAIYSYNSDPVVIDTILWGNSDSTVDDWDVVVNHSGEDFGITYSNFSGIYIISGGVDAWNCISVDPQFADAGNNDFHLKSPDGRWNGSSWVTTDTVYSKCLVHAHPTNSYSNEPTPNGSKRNMGVYGNTSEASKVDPNNLGDLNVQVFISGSPPVEGPQNALWRLSYEQDGTWHSPYNTGSFTMEGLVPASDYYVVFKDVSGYITPSTSGPFSITSGNTTVIAGYYTEE